jgi:hypothetical protein
VAELQRTNGTLLQKLDASVAEIARLRSSGGGGHAAVESYAGNPAAKIAQMAKKNREMIASVNAEKARSAKLVGQIAEMEQEMQVKIRDVDKYQHISKRLRKQLDGGNGSGSAAAGGGDGAAASAPEKQAPESERLTQARQECQQLRQKLKMAQSALQKEIGSDIPLSRVLSTESGWKGRADEISRLKVKINELHQKAESGGGSGSSHPPPSTHPRSPGTAIENRNIKAVKVSDALRRREMEQAAMDLDVLRVQYGKLKEVETGLKARTRTLSRDGKALKEKLAQGARESEKDANVIENLKAQLIRAAKSQLAQQTPTDFETINSPAAHKAEVNRLHSVCEQFKVRVSALEGALQQRVDGADRPLSRSASDGARLASLHALCEQQNARISSLEGALRAASARSSSFTSPGPLSSRPTSGVRGDSMEVARLQALNDQQQSRIVALEARVAQQQQPHPHPHPHPQPHPHQQQPSASTGRPSSARSSRGSSAPRPPSGRNGRVGSAHAYHDPEPAIALRAAHVEREKMNQLVEMLKDRLADAEQTIMATDSLDGDGGDGGVETIPAGTTLEAVWNKLMLEQDNNRALRSNLRDTVEAKESEITLLHSMMKETRRVFSEGLRKMKASQAPLAGGTVGGSVPGAGAGAGAGHGHAQGHGHGHGQDPTAARTRPSSSRGSSGRMRPPQQPTAE